jgi:hypothetical protein
MQRQTSCGAEMRFDESALSIEQDFRKQVERFDLELDDFLRSEKGALARSDHARVAVHIPPGLCYFKFSQRTQISGHDLIDKPSVATDPAHQPGDSNRRVKIPREIL